MIKIKNIIIFIVCLVPWFVSSLFPFNEEFYNSLTLPFFTPPNAFYGVAWTLVYICTAISIYKIVTNYKLEDLKRYFKILVINYLFNQSFTLVFFTLENTFLGFISCLGTFISTLFLYEETTNLDEKSTKYLNPYVLLSLFATVLSLTIYILNAR